MDKQTFESSYKEANDKTGMGNLVAVKLYQAEWALLYGFFYAAAEKSGAKSMKDIADSIYKQALNKIDVY